MEPFHLSIPNNKISPIILSVPHSGIDFPIEIKDEYKQDMLPPDDTDWFVDYLYSFAAELNLTVISAKYSRWVIDLNRNPDGMPLYNDGRVITALCPATNFLGDPIYNDERKEVSPEETLRRRINYFNPYHKKLQELLDAAKQEWGAVLLWDCHSIRRMVPSIQAAPFPDLVLGSADQTSASQNIINKTLSMLQKEAYTLQHNHPFKGGYITRSKGNPSANQHALQLEMAKPLYMDDTETKYDDERAGKIQTLLINTLKALQQELLSN